MIGTYERDSVTWLQNAGYDTYGDPNTPTSVSVSARVKWATSRVVNQQGQEILASGSLLMSGRPTADKDKIRIAGVDHLVVAVREIKSFSRVSHYEVFIQ